MTPPKVVPVTCACCGAQAQHIYRSAYQSEPPDFDTRPGGMARSLLRFWVFRCPHCGYCADDLTRIQDGVAEIVASGEYQEQLADPRFPALARTFLCYALILDKLRHRADAGWSCLHAAWACDNENSEEAARLCRAAAIQQWKRGKAVGEPFADDMASEFALVTDLYRRMGEFEQATVACGEGLDIEDVPPAIEQMLRRQIVLIQQRDTACHSMAELQPKRPDDAGG